MSRVTTLIFALLLTFILAMGACSSGSDQAIGERGDDDTPPAWGDDDAGDDDDDDDDNDDDGAGSGKVEIVSPQEDDVIVGYQVGVEVNFDGIPDSFQLLLDGVDKSEALNYFPETGTAWGDLHDVTEGGHLLTAKGWYEEVEHSDSVQFSTTLEGAARIELTLSENQVPISGQVTASWQVFNEYNQDVSDQVSVELTVDPAAGATVVNNTITFSEAGAYDVTAATTWNDDPISDTDTVVVFDTGEIDRLVMDCSPTNITAGETVTCTSTIYDEDNNVVPGSVIYTVNPSLGSTVNGNQITLTYAAIVRIIGTVAGTNVTDRERITVNAGSAHTVELTLNPTELVVDETSTATTSIVDEYGNPVAGEVELEIVPSTGVTINGNQITPHKAGMFVVTAWALSHSVQDSETLNVTENFPPQIIITEPERGEFVFTQSINLLGQAIDEHSDIADVHVNGVPVYFIPETGVFTTALSLELGLNTIVVEAWDEYDNYAMANVSALYLGAYLPNGDIVENAIGARINQPGLDSLELIAEDLIETFRSIIMTLIPDPLFDETLEVWGLEIAHADAHIDSVDYDPIDIELTHSTGGLHLAGLANNFSLQGTLNYSIFDDAGPTDDTATFEVTVDNMTLSGDLLVSLNLDGTLHADLVNVDVAVNGLTTDIHGGGLFGDILDWVIGMFTSDIAQLMEDLAQDLIVDLVPPLLEELLNELDELAFDFELLTFHYYFEALFSEVDFTSEGGEIWLDSHSWYGDGSWTVGPNTPDLPGSLLTYYPSFPTFGIYVPGTSNPFGFGVTISDDLLNQLLHVVHRSGMLSLNLDEETLEMLGIEDFQLTTTWLALFMPGIVPAFGLGKTVEIRLRPKLPPIFIMNPQKGLQTEIQFGDFILEWWCEEEPDQWTLFAKVALALFIPTEITVSEEQTIKLEFGEFEMYADLFEEPVFEIGDAFFEELVPLLVELLVPALLGDLLEEIPIPSFAGFTLQVNEFQSWGPGNDWMGLFGDLIQVPPDSLYLQMALP